MNYENLKCKEIMPIYRKEWVFKGYIKEPDSFNVVITNSKGIEPAEIFVKAIPFCSNCYHVVALKCFKDSKVENLFCLNGETVLPETLKEVPEEYHDTNLHSFLNTVFY